MSKNRAVLYLRLSKEDVNKLNAGDDSASIRNQRLLLTEYAQEHGFDIIQVYSDDDESGLYDDRPAFEQMIKDAGNGEYDVIIAKSQSRFSRNMEHIEKYLHHYLPNLGIRFIGVVDGTDTNNRENKKSRQINGLVNEWYCEDLSANIRSAFRAKMKDGQFLGSSCPYGYKKDPLNHNHLIIDEYAAEIVRKIYRLYISGIGKAKIGSILSSEGVLIPTRYKREVLGINYHNSKVLDTTVTWSYQTIHTILNNQTYIGNLVQNRTNSLSYKDKKQRQVPESEWIIVKHTHEPIIDKDTFDKVQNLQRIRTKSVRIEDSNSVFAGMIFCADCKRAMSRKYDRRGEHKFIGYVCKTYKTQGKQFCNSHSINNKDLEYAVLCSIKQEARKILKTEDIDELQEMELYDNIKKQYEMQLENIKMQITKIERFKKKTYSNYMEELISKQDYLSFVSDYDKQIQALYSQKKNVLEKMDAQSEIQQQYDEWAEAFKDYINIDKLTRDMVLELIEKIEVNEDGSINIYYCFQNPYA